MNPRIQIILSICLLNSIADTVLAQPLFLKQFTYNNFTTFTSIVTVDTSSIFLFGDSKDFSLSYRSTDVVKINHEGNILMQKQIILNNNTVLRDVLSVKNYDNTITLAGNTDASSLTNIGCARIDTACIPMWGSALKLPLFEKFSDLIATKDSGNLVVGELNINSVGGTSKGAAIKYDKYGDIAWIREYGFNGRTVIKSAIEKSNGNYILFGNTTDISDTINNVTSDLLIIEVNDSGAILQSKTFSSPAPDVAYKVLTGDNDNLYFGIMTGAFNGASSQELVLIKTDSAFNVIWSNLYRGFSGGVGNTHYAYLIQPETGGFLFSEGFLTIRLEDNGNITWQSEAYFPGSYSYRAATQLHNNTYMLTGAVAQSPTSVPQSGAVAKIDSTGISACNQKFITKVFIVPVSISLQNLLYDSDTISIVDSSGVTIDTLNFQVTGICTGYVSDTTSFFFDNEVKVYPTLVNEKIWIEFNSVIPFDVQIFSLEGKIIKNIKLSGNTRNEISISGLKGGMYLLKIIAGEEYYISKIIKK
jgi:type IX secretion system substrate protein